MIRDRGWIVFNAQTGAIVQVDRVKGGARKRLNIAVCGDSTCEASKRIGRIIYCLRLAAFVLRRGPCPAHVTYSQLTDLRSTDSVLVPLDSVSFPGFHKCGHEERGHNLSSSGVLCQNTTFIDLERFPMSHVTRLTCPYLLTPSPLVLIMIPPSSRRFPYSSPSALHAYPVDL